jgi:hypothetical protein
MSAVYAAVPAKLTNPWKKGGDYKFDRSLLRKLIGVQVAGGSAMNAPSGGLALAVDVWLATELRRAGIAADAVWPRETRPRVVPQGLSKAAEDFSFSGTETTRTIQEQALAKLIDKTGSGQSNILGGYFRKEIDVVMADWDRGLELGISSKTMTGSAAKNVGNRFEEAAGDLANIRRRYPMAAFGYAYLVTRNVVEDEPAAWERIKDMLRKLTTLSTNDESASYDATCLIVAHWPGGKVSLDEDCVPADLSPDVFLDRMLRTLFSRSPVSEHVEARELWKNSSPAQIDF